MNAPLTALYSIASYRRLMSSNENSAEGARRPKVGAADFSISIPKSFDHESISSRWPSFFFSLQLQ